MSQESQYSQNALARAQVAQPSAHTHQPVRSGALTILITFVALALAVLAVLTFSTAQADLALTKRMQRAAQQTASTESAAQEWLAAVALSIKNAGPRLSAQNAATLLKDLPQGTTISPEGIVHINIKIDTSSYLIAQVQINDTDKRYEIVRWQLLREWEPDEELSLWKGE